MAFLQSIVTALKQAGLTAYTERALYENPIPLLPEYVAVGIVGGGHGALRLRFRIYGDRGCEPDSLTAVWEREIVPVLRQTGLTVGIVKLSELRYDSTLDRALREAEIIVPARLAGSGA